MMTKTKTMYHSDPPKAWNTTEEVREGDTTTENYLRKLGYTDEPQGAGEEPADRVRFDDDDVIATD